MKFRNLLPWKGVEAAGKRFKKGVEISRFTDMPPYISNSMPVEAGQVERE